MNDQIVFWLLSLPVNKFRSIKKIINNLRRHGGSNAAVEAVLIAMMESYYTEQSHRQNIRAIR